MPRRGTPASAGFIDEQRDRFGVEPICSTLQVAPSSYYAARSRPPSVHERRDAELAVEVARVHAQQWAVYGARKVWHQLAREGISAGRDRVGRLMRGLGLAGVRRGRPPHTTQPTLAERPADLVGRVFATSAPNRLWVADITYVRLGSGFCYAAFVVDAFSRRIVGWRVAASLRAELGLQRNAGAPAGPRVALPEVVPRRGMPAGAGPAARARPEIVPRRGMPAACWPGRAARSPRDRASWRNASGCRRGRAPDRPEIVPRRGMPSGCRPGRPPIARDRASQRNAGARRPGLPAGPPAREPGATVAADFLPVSLDMPRILLYTGKGGVGKTSVAAASALLAAERGYRTIVFSTDIAHSLTDALGVPLGPEPVEIAPNLWGQEPDVFYNVQHYWATIQRYVATLFSWHGLDEVMAEEMTILPGMDELGSLLWIADHMDQGRFDVIVVDAAPTGETLRLLSLPEASRWWVERIAPIGRRVTKLGGPLIQKMIGMPVPDQDVFEAAERLLRRLDQVHGILADPDLTSVRVVMNLDKMSIAEAQRSFTYFHLYGYPSDLVIANRVIPPGVGGTFLAEWRESQQRYLPMVEDAFAPVPIRQVPYFQHEMVGLDLLRELGHKLFIDVDPASIFYRGRPYAVSRVNGGYVLTLELPFASRDEVHLTRHADELLLQVGLWRRTLVLPRALVDAPTTGAKMEDNTLRVTFGGRTTRTGGT